MGAVITITSLLTGQRSGERSRSITWCGEIEGSGSFTIFSLAREQAENAWAKKYNYSPAGFVVDFYTELK